MNFLPYRAELCHRSGSAPTNDLESALLVRLEPGAYTTVVSGSETSEVGIALVEVYEVGHH